LSCLDDGIRAAMRTHRVFHTTINASRPPYRTSTLRAHVRARLVQTAMAARMMVAVTPDRSSSL
jgi:hypothetical protein